MLLLRHHQMHLKQVFEECAASDYIRNLATPSVLKDSVSKKEPLSSSQVCWLKEVAYQIGHTAVERLDAGDDVIGTDLPGRQLQRRREQKDEAQHSAPSPPEPGGQTVP